MSKPSTKFDSFGKLEGYTEDNFDQKLEGLETELTKEEMEEAFDELAKKEGRVTILGSGDRMDFLKNIKIAVQSLGNYRCIIIEKIPHFKYETPRQKVHSFLSSSKFVIADNCKPSGELLELEYCRNAGVITAILAQKSQKLASWMSIDFHIHSKDFELFDYEKEDVDYLKEFMKSVIVWVENRCNEREQDIEDVKKRYGY